MTSRSCVPGLFIAVVAISVFCLSEGSAEAAVKPAPIKAARTVRAGARARFFLSIGEAASCAVRLTGTVRTLSNASRFDRIEVFVDTPRRTKPGRYGLFFRCSNSVAARLLLTVQGIGKREGTLTSIGHGLHLLGVHVRPITPDEAASKARERWLREEAVILSGYRTGQCTDWAAQKRPDVVQRVDEAIFVSELLHTQGPTSLGDAKNWPAAAAAVGFTISDQPAPHSLVVWQGGVEHAALATGHIGYVESVSPDGLSFYESSMNVGGIYMMEYRVLSSAPVPGRSFILP